VVLDGREKGEKKRRQGWGERGIDRAREGGGTEGK